MTNLSDKKRFSFRFADPGTTKMLVKFYKDVVGDKVIMDEPTQSHIAQVAEWLIDSPKWGLAFIGGVGNGKTTMLKALFDTLQFSYDYMYDKYRCKRAEIGYYTAHAIVQAAQNDTTLNSIIQGTQILGIDDFGYEPTEIQVYGNIKAPVSRIIEDKYMRRSPIIITTNLDSDAIREKYGVRISDRMREMFQVVKFTNPSYRN